MDRCFNVSTFHSHSISSGSLLFFISHTQLKMVRFKFYYYYYCSIEHRSQIGKLFAFYMRQQHITLALLIAYSINIDEIRIEVDDNLQLSQAHSKICFIFSRFFWPFNLYCTSLTKLQARRLSHTLKQYYYTFVDLKNKIY